jgi:hypothetical protein
MAKRKGDDVETAEADLMAVVEATDPTAADPASEVVPERAADAPVAQPERRGGGGAFVGMVLGGVIAAGAGFGLARLAPDLLAAESDSQLAETVQAQAAEIAALREQIAALPAKPGPDADLMARVAALESAAAPDLSGIEGRIAALESKVDGFASGAAGGASPDLAAELQALKDQVARLGSGGTVPADVTAAAEAAEARLKEAEARAVAMAEEAEAAAVASRRAAAVDRVAAALDSGAPFQGALRDLGADVPPVLMQHAATGLPTVAELADSFPGAARNALEAALRANMGESWTDRVSNFLRSQTGLRSLSPREGNDPDAVLSRAEAALEAGDVATAMTELQAMPEAGKPALADWLAEAQVRVEAEAAFASLSAN